MIRGIPVLFIVGLSTAQCLAQYESVRVGEHQVLVMEDSVFVPKKDTTILLPANTMYQVHNNKYILSDGFYDSIYALAKKNRLTRELFNLLVTTRPPQDSFQNKEPVKSEDFFKRYSGKTISSIEYVSVDLFGGSVNDTTLKAKSGIGKLSNELHKNTSKEVIYKHLLFNVGDNVDPFRMADTERIIRSLPYIEDSRIKLEADPKNPEAVHAIVIVKDRFPWSIDLSIDDNDAFRTGFTNKNIFGTGNEFSVGYLYNGQELPTHGYDAHYTMRNIKDSFIDGTVFISDSYEGRSRGISFKRNFLSPNIKYFGEATLELVEPIADLIFADSLYEKDFRIERQSYDIWGGRSFLLEDRKSINAALRIQHDNFGDRPAVQADSNAIYHDHHFLVGALSYSKINFLKTKNIFAFNITEDVPVGFLYAIILGKDFTEFGRRDYRGFETSHSFYNKKYGYFLINLETGFFEAGGQRKDQVFQLDGRHFTPLFDFWGAYSRAFTRFHYFNGNRLSIPVSQSLATENGIKTIEGNQIRGDRIFTLTTEYVVFQPWYFYGFRFATYAHIGIGNVQESRITDPFNKTYFTAGGGLRIRNESLVFNTIEFRISAFSDAPTEGQTFTFKVSLSVPQSFESPTVRKPKIVGLD